METDTPVAYSVLSCVVTNICLVPLFVTQKGSFKLLSRPMLRGFALVCLAIAGDLVFTNVALALLSVALQQTIKGVSPAATVLVERMFGHPAQRPAVYATLGVLCVGPVLTGMGSSYGDASPYGVAMMVLSVFSGAFKYVLAHRMITTYKKELGTFAFLFWVECFVAAILTPWAIASGEARLLLLGTDRSTSQWLLLYFTAAYGGVRIYSQLYLLEHTSATTLALSTLAVQALTIVLGVIFFGTPATACLVAGVLVTVGASALYTWLKLTAKASRTAAAQEPPQPPVAEGAAARAHALRVAGGERCLEGRDDAKDEPPDEEPDEGLGLESVEEDGKMYRGTQEPAPSQQPLEPS